MVSLTLHQAVYGPLANGSNVQLLAHSHGIPLDRPALSEFGKFYYAGWKIAERDRASFNAFLPLDAQHWGFVHAYVAGERSMGVMFVNWMLVLDVADLDKIGWRTNLLWDVLAGQSQSAPSPGTVLEPLAITLDPGGGTSALDEAADNLAYSVHLGLGAGKGVRVGADNGFGLAEAGLAAALGRLGPMAAQCSYCTSAPLVAAGYETLAGPFAILSSESDIGDGRALATAA